MIRVTPNVAIRVSKVHSRNGRYPGENCLGARLRGRTATQRSKKGSEKVLGRVLEKGFSEGF